MLISKVSQTYYKTKEFRICGDSSTFQTITFYTDIQNVFFYKQIYKYIICRFFPFFKNYKYDSIFPPF